MERETIKGLEKNLLSNISTKDLTTELLKRQGVRSVTLENDDQVEVVMRKTANVGRTETFRKK